MPKKKKTPSPFNAADYTDRTGTWRSPQGISILIRCIDARRSYGRLELRIEPIDGTGDAWVQSPYVTLYPPLTQERFDIVMALAHEWATYSKEERKKLRAEYVRQLRLLEMPHFESMLGEDSLTRELQARRTKTGPAHISVEPKRAP